MQEALDFAKEFWFTLFIPLIWSLIKLVNWRKKSTNDLYSQLETMKQDIIRSVQRDIERAKEVAEKDKIIHDFKIHCPDCYDRIFSEKK